jgi:hypothetical protein
VIELHVRELRADVVQVGADDRVDVILATYGGTLSEPDPPPLSWFDTEVGRGSVA